MTCAGGGGEEAKLTVSYPTANPMRFCCLDRRLSRRIAGQLELSTDSSHCSGRLTVRHVHIRIVARLATLYQPVSAKGIFPRESESLVRLM